VSFLASAGGGSPSSDGQTHTKAAAMGEYNTQATITSRGETRTEVKIKKKSLQHINGDNIQPETNQNE
jgi:hypothetical protein